MYVTCAENYIPECMTAGERRERERERGLVVEKNGHFIELKLIPVNNSSFLIRTRVKQTSCVLIGSRELQTFDLYVDVVAGVSGNDRLQGS